MASSRSIWPGGLVVNVADPYRVQGCGGVYRGSARRRDPRLLMMSLSGSGWNGDGIGIGIGNVKRTGMCAALPCFWMCVAVETFGDMPTSERGHATRHWMPRGSLAVLRYGPLVCNLASPAGAFYVPDRYWNHWN